MITQQHQPNEFKPNANGQRACRWANKKLAELQTAPSDPMLVDHLTRSYLAMLKCGHKNGAAGSLLVAEAVQ